jgi:hypothetical protein
MIRLLVAASALLLTSCSGSAGVNIGGPPSAQSVAQNDSDFTGVVKCSESGSYDSYLKAEQTKSPDQYQSDKKTWDDLKAKGANDSYIADYADNTADCGSVGSSNLTGKVAAVFAIRFKDTWSASRG